MRKTDKPTIYYLPGRGGQLGVGLGQALLDRGYGVTGREVRGDFASWDFSEQVACVADDVGKHFWRADALVIANSFGAYLLLHALAGKVAFPGRVLILSPIVGESFDAVSGQSFVPPRAGDLHKLSRAGAYPRPKACEIHVGKDDWQSNPASVCLKLPPFTGQFDLLESGRCIL